jgi:hypothetical protein
MHIWMHIFFKDTPIAFMNNLNSLLGLTVFIVRLKFKMNSPASPCVTVLDWSAICLGHNSLVGLWGRRVGLDDHTRGWMGQHQNVNLGPMPGNDNIWAMNDSWVPCVLLSLDHKSYWSDMYQLMSVMTYKDTCRSRYLGLDLDAVFSWAKEKSCDFCGLARFQDHLTFTYHIPK